MLIRFQGRRTQSIPCRRSQARYPFGSFPFGESLYSTEPIHIHVIDYKKENGKETQWGIGEIDLRAMSGDVIAMEPPRAPGPSGDGGISYGV
jgi:hypothetical protein